MQNIFSYFMFGVASIAITDASAQIPLPPATYNYQTAPGTVNCYPVSCINPYSTPGTSIYDQTDPDFQETTAAIANVSPYPDPSVSVAVNTITDADYGGGKAFARMDYYFNVASQSATNVGVSVTYNMNDFADTFFGRPEGFFFVWTGLSIYDTTTGQLVENIGAGFHHLSSYDCPICDYAPYQNGLSQASGTTDMDITVGDIYQVTIQAGVFNGFDGAIAASLDPTFALDGLNSGDVQLNFSAGVGNIPAVAEPGTLWLLLCAMGLLWRRQAASSAIARPATGW